MTKEVSVCLEIAQLVVVVFNVDLAFKVRYIFLQPSEESLIPYETFQVYLTSFIENCR